MEQNQIFSTRFSTDKDDSYCWIDYGRLNTDHANVTSMKNLTVYDDYFWSMGMKGIRVGVDGKSAVSGVFQDNNTQAIMDKDGGLYTIFDSATNKILISDLFFKSFIEMFFQKAHKMDVEDFKVEKGFVTSKCTSFKPLYFLMGDVWLMVRPEDYYYKTGSQCAMRFQPIDAPFNILGLPVYKDYYVSHNFSKDNASMSFQGLTNEIKPMPEDASEFMDGKPDLIKVTLATENAEDPEQTTLVVALILAVGVLVGMTIWAVWGFTNDKFSGGIMALIIIGGVVGAGLIFFLALIFVYEAVTPGNTDAEVEDGDQAIIKVGKVTVKATHVGVFSLLAYAFYKLTGKKEEQKTTPVEAVEEEEEVLSNYLM